MERANSRSRATFTGRPKLRRLKRGVVKARTRMTRKGEKKSVCVRKGWNGNDVVCVCVWNIPPRIVQGKMSVGIVVPTTADCCVQFCCARRKTA